MVNRTQLLKFLALTTLTTSLLLFQNCSWQFKSVSEFSDLPSTAFSEIGNGVSGGGGGVSSSVSAPYSLTKTLSREESLNAAKDLVGTQLVSDQLIYLLPPDEKTAGFESASVKIFNEAYVNGRLKFSEAVVDAALNSPQVMTCYPGFAENTAWAGCIQTIVTQFATRAFSRAPTSEELASWRSLYQSTAETIKPFLGTNILGNLDTVTAGLEVLGWSMDPRWSDRPIQIQIYVDGAIGTGTLVGTTLTRLARPDVIRYFEQAEQITHTGNHGFSFRLPVRYANGQPHTVHAYAVVSDGTTGNPTLIGTANFRSNPIAQVNNDEIRTLSPSTRESLKNVLTAILMSPSFQLREPPQVSGESSTAYESRRLARKIALFVSGSLPDAALLQAAERGELSDPQVIRSHAARLFDQNLSRFVSNSFGQWFGFRDFSRVSELTAIERAMVTESQMVFQEILRLDLPFESILTPGFSFLNQELANHYGVTGVNSPQFVKVNQQLRGGILTQGSVLRLTSPSANTKVIQRGKWIMSNLLCQIIPSPDTSLREMAIAESVSQLPPGSSVKETLAFHRATGPACYNCHKQMDPLGLSLEVFDSFGRARTTYPDSKPVEADGELNGVPFNGPYQLAPIIAQQQFKNCVTRKLLTHGLGREVESADDATALSLSSSTNIKELVLRIVTSRIFIDEARRNQ